MPLEKQNIEMHVQSQLGLRVGGGEERGGWGGGQAEIGIGLGQVVGGGGEEEGGLINGRRLIKALSLTPAVVFGMRNVHTPHGPEH